MHGCDNYCSYCIVPYVRGREISRDPRSILDEITVLEERGVREITLLGQNVNSYRWEKDGKTVDFPQLLRMAAKHVKGIRWVRFLSSHPKDLSADVVSAMRDYPVLCRHVHLCVQHGSNRILQAMNRRYTREQYLELVDLLRSELPDVSLSTDILIGFPGETEEDVEETLELMHRVEFAYSYMYHYNPREGTAAYSLPDRISDAVKKARLARVIELQQETTKRLMLARVGTRQTVLVDGFSKRDSSELVGRTHRDEMVAFPGPASLVGSFADLTISSLRGTTFRAKEASPCPGV
jgi:tRNA-2-methylthio-N6-dimethylallyladenosine synthase